MTWSGTECVPTASTKPQNVVALNASVPIHWIHALVQAGWRLSSACLVVRRSPFGPARQASVIWMVAAVVKKIEPTKYVAAATVGSSDVAKLIGTPTAKQADPTAKSHPIQDVARREGVRTAAIVGSPTRGSSDSHPGYR